MIETRRIFLVRSAGFLALAGGALSGAPSLATPQAMAALIAEIAAGREIKKGKVTLDLPPLIDNGNAVPMTVTVDSPMSERDYVKTIHVVNEKNPQPHVIVCHLGPRAGRAAFSTRIKLADAQTVTAIVEMSDGTLWMDSANVIVTLAACLEDIL
ncbi:SoxY-related AACIE arm protein [Methylocella sp. CPCC 101449]|uniref:SoxY-related AACIE arm protein n=1 Tax=Methylocella sp. CPCC 101449 TaxID=2987531 RepID=UPI00288F0811|nr:SoxY-related AACIE arm protein [Methylocella sp. CPCC 101449]MDT2022859.1 SoxY-related AACIE arm protein [Methylocella sp. CPCC 101449]